MLEQKCKSEKKRSVNNYGQLEDTATNLKLTSRVGKDQHCHTQSITHDSVEGESSSVNGHMIRR